MAKTFSRKWLEAMGIEADKVDALVEAHSEIVKAVIDERDELKTKVEQMTKEMVAKTELTKVQTELADLKESQRKKEERGAKEEALKAVYKEAGIADKFLPALIRIADFDKMEMDGNGGLKNHKEMVEAAKKDYAEFVPEVKEQNGQNTPAPPSGGKVKMSKTDILKITDRAERQKAIAENMDAFGY